MLKSHEVDFIHHIVETVMNTLSIIFNTILLYLIVNHSSFGTPIYQILLAIDASLDLTFSVIVLVGQTVVITGDGYLIYMANGFFAGWSYRFDMFLIFIWLWVLHLNIMWIPVQFVYRYTFLCLRENRVKAKKINVVAAMCTVAWAIIGFAMTHIYAYRDKGFQEQGRHVLAVNEWDVSDYVVTIGAKLTEWMLQYFLIMWFCTCFLAISIVIVVEFKIKAYFSSIGGVSHQSTKKLHKDFHRALLAMAITPLVTTTVPVLYYITASLLGLSPGPMQCFIAVACTSITMLNPLTTILAMRCYRNVIVRPFLSKKSRVDGNITRATGLSVATSTFVPTRSAVASSASSETAHS